MLILLLLLIPLTGLFIIASTVANSDSSNAHIKMVVNREYNVQIKRIALNASVCALAVSLVMFALFDFSSNSFQFVQEYHDIGLFNLYLGIDGLSIYFVLLTTIIMPISLLSN